MDGFIYTLYGGWWMLSGMLQGEVKCKTPESYDEYCIQFIKYLSRYIDTPSLVDTDRRGIYGTSSR